MTEDKNKKAGDADKEPVILDAEVVEEKSAKPHKAAGEKITSESKPSQEKSSGTTLNNAGDSAKWAWRMVILLVAFIGGLFAAPQFEKGLIFLGLKDQATITPIITTKDNGSNLPLITIDDLKASNDRIAILEKKITELTAQSSQQNTTMVRVENQKKIQDISGQLVTLQKDINTLAGKSVGKDILSGPTQQNFDALKTSVENMQQSMYRLAQLSNDQNQQSSTSIGDVEQMKGALALARAENQKLSTRLQAIETMMLTIKQSSVQSNPRGRLVLSIAQLRAKLLSGQPYGTDLIALKPDLDLLGTGDQVQAYSLVKEMQALGGQVTTLAELKASYATMAKAVKKAEVKAENSFFADMFTVRKTGADAVGIDKTLFQAETALTARDLAGAISILHKGLTGTTQGQAASWLKQASDHMTAESKLDNLLRIVAGSTAASGGQ